MKLVLISNFVKDMIGVFKKSGSLKLLLLFALYITIDVQCSFRTDNVTEMAECSSRQLELLSNLEDLLL